MKLLLLLLSFLLLSSAFLFLHPSPSWALSPDGQALLSLKNNLHSTDNLSDWNPFDSTPCSWTGVTCDNSSSQTIVRLDLSSQNLGGSISQSIQLLMGLTYLNISNNRFSGPIPLSLANLTNLQFLDISHNYFNSSIPQGFFLNLRSLLNFTSYSNNFTGPLPLDFAHLPFLQHLDLAGSYFSGPIPPEYGGFASLKYLDLSGNSLSGNIPPQLGNLRTIERLKIGWNNFEGGIPPSLGNLSSLRYLDIVNGNLTGSIPASLGKLSNLNTLFLYSNKISGHIPPQLGHMTSLMSLDLSMNEFTGGIPDSFVQLKNLTLLSLMYNNLSGKIPTGIADLPNLEMLHIWNNSFSGNLPQNLGLVAPLKWVDVSSNNFTGKIPPNLCAGGKLYKLILFSNQFSGPVPKSLVSCRILWRVRLEDNQLDGSIPPGFGALQNLTWFDVSRNRLAGGIPIDLTFSPSLQYLDVSNNKMRGNLPSGMWNMQALQTFYASSCELFGILPEFSKCPPLLSINLSRNLLSGNIPKAIGQCQTLLLLDLSRNKLTGDIPSQLANLISLHTLDLSHNLLTGSIPSHFQYSTALDAFDVSYNNLSGQVPSQGYFRFINPKMLAGNPDLCDGVLRPCLPYKETLSSSVKKGPRPVAWVVAGLVFMLTLIILIAGCWYFYKQYESYLCSKVQAEEAEGGAWKLTAFQRLNLAVDEIVKCLNSTNIIGMGAAGTVYKAELQNGDVIAVKKLWINQKEVTGKRQQILGEVDVLGSVRHRNIVKLLGLCANDHITLLLYEYMPNGSLGDILHGSKESNILADWMTRYKIAMGVAQGLCYLHHDCFPVIVHRDVKSNNILLDSDMEARVADFGVAKLLESTESMSVVAGSYGYIAPEYAHTMQVDERSDIYSFGVVLLELLTGKRPIEPEFGDSVNIVDWVREKIHTSEGVAKVLDGNIGASLSWIREEMTLVLRVALLCTSKSPTDRPSMRDVVTMLSEAKPRRKSIKECYQTTVLL